jgi:hypothetical protein
MSDIGLIQRCSPYRQIDVADSPALLKPNLGMAALGEARPWLGIWQRPAPPLPRPGFLPAPDRFSMGDEDNDE